MPTDSKIPGWEAFLREIKLVLEQYHSLDKEIAVLRTEQRKDVKAQEQNFHFTPKPEGDGVEFSGYAYADSSFSGRRLTPAEFLQVTTSVNKVRGHFEFQDTDVRNTMVNQPVYNAEHADILQRLNILTTFKDNYEGKQSQIMRNTIVISIIVPLIVSLVLIIISHYWH